MWLLIGLCGFVAAVPSFLQVHDDDDDDDDSSDGAPQPHRPQSAMARQLDAVSDSLSKGETEGLQQLLNAIASSPRHDNPVIHRDSDGNLYEDFRKKINRPNGPRAIHDAEHVGKKDARMVHERSQTDGETNPVIRQGSDNRSEDFRKKRNQSPRAHDTTTPVGKTDVRMRLDAEKPVEKSEAIKPVAEKLVSLPSRNSGTDAMARKLHAVEHELEFTREKLRYANRAIRKLHFLRHLSEHYPSRKLQVPYQKRSFTHERKPRYEMRPDERD